MSAGLHFAIDPLRYHSDPAPQPSLSSHVAAVLLDRSADHARLMHPRLNPAYDPAALDKKRRLQFGSAAHAMLLGKDKQIEIIDADSYRTKAAQRLPQNPRRSQTLRFDTLGC